MRVMKINMRTKKIIAIVAATLALIGIFAFFQLAHPDDLSGAWQRHEVQALAISAVCPGYAHAVTRDDSFVCAAADGMWLASVRELRQDEPEASQDGQGSAAEPAPYIKTRRVNHEGRVLILESRLNQVDSERFFQGLRFID